MSSIISIVLIKSSLAYLQAPSINFSCLTIFLVKKTQRHGGTEKKLNTKNTNKIITKDTNKTNNTNMKRILTSFVLFVLFVTFVIKYLRVSVPPCFAFIMFCVSYGLEFVDVKFMLGLSASELILPFDSEYVIFF